MAAEPNDYPGRHFLSGRIVEENTIRVDCSGLIPRPAHALAGLVRGAQNLLMVEDVLLERDRELADLERAVDSVVGGTSEVVIVSGSAGLGKTWLLQRARQIAVARGLRVLSARGSSLEREYPSGVVRQLFEPMVAAASDEDRRQWSDVSRQAVDAILRPVGQETVTAGEYAVLHGLFWLTSDLASAGPVALFLDDLHWADESSLRFVAYLLPRLEDLRVLLVGTLRPGEPGAASHLLDVITADPACRLMRPGPLGPRGSAVLLGGVFDQVPESGFATACHEATGGNPLLLTELARAALVERLDPTDSNVGQVMRVGAQALGRRVQLQLGQLSAELVRLAESISVLAPHADLAVAARLGGLSLEEARTGVVELEGCNLISTSQQNHGPTSYGFVHPLVQAAVYEEINSGRLVRYHEAAVDELTKAAAAPEQVAAHLLRLPPAGDAHRVTLLRNAASSASSRGAPEAALTYLRRAIAEPPPAPDLTDLFTEAGLVAVQVDLPAAADYLTQAVRRTQDPVVRATLAAPLGLVLFHTDRVNDAVTTLTEAIDQLPPDHDDLQRTLEAVLLNVPSAAAGFNELTERIPRLRRLPPSDTLGAHLLNGMIGILDTFVGDPEWLDRTREATTDPALIRAAGQGNLMGSSVLWSLVVGAPEEGIAVCDAVIAEARGAGSLTALLPALIYRGFGWLACGELADAEADLREALRLAQLAGLALAPSTILAMLAETVLEQGKVDEAESILQGVPTPRAQAGLLFNPLQARARVLRVRGRHEEALRTAMAAGARFAEHAGGGQNPAMVAWRSEAALCLHAIGRHEEAADYARAEVALARRWGAPYALGRALRVAGMISAETVALDLLREAVDVLQPSSAHLEHAKAAVALGAALRRNKARGEARVYLSTGLELAHRCGAAPLIGQALTELRIAGARPRRTFLTGPESLTASERRVADLATQNHTNRQIAQELFVTVKTVEIHLSAAYRKLGITKRSGLRSALGANAETASRTVAAPR